MLELDAPEKLPGYDTPEGVGFGKGDLLEEGSCQKSSFSRVSGEFRDSREPPDSGKQRRIRPFLGM